MEIIWHGQSFFEIKTKGTDKEPIAIAIDPFGEKSGLKIPKIEAQILLISHSDDKHSGAESVQEKPFLISAPGEYGIKGILIKSVLSRRGSDNGKEIGRNIIYKIESEQIKICHLGDLGQKELNESQVEEIGEVDVLMIPVGGRQTGPVMDGKTAAEIISQIEPRLIIPMHYKLPKATEDLEGLEKFLKAMGEEKIEPQKKIKISPKDLPSEEAKIVVLEP